MFTFGVFPKAILLNRIDRLMMAASNHYSSAIDALNSLQSNAETIAKIISSQDSKRHLNIPNMINYLKRCDIELEDLSRLSVIHISGTKGKGSTSAFCESILRRYGYTTGMFTSPHLVSVTERFRLNGHSVDQQLFSKYFWEVYSKLDDTKETIPNPDRPMPSYFMMLTVMAFYMFLKENVDAVILEVGVGGEYDSTNVLKQPVVCGVTSLGLDHTLVLGNTIDKIAWQKAGIFKRGVPAVTVPQPLAAMETLIARANEKGAALYLAPAFDTYNDAENIHLGIAGSIQRHNATLALQLCRIWIHNHDKDISERKWLSRQSHVGSEVSIPELDAFRICDEMEDGLVGCSWPGRNQTLNRPGITYYFDGAHTVESIQQCASWFQDESEKEMLNHKGQICRILIFNVTKDRNPAPFLSILKQLKFDAAVFCPNLAFTDGRHNKPEQDNRCVTRENQLSYSDANKHIWDNMDTVSAAKMSLIDKATTLGVHNALHRNGLVDDCWDRNICTSACTTESRAFPCLMQSLYWAGQGRDPTVKPVDDLDVPVLSDRLQASSHVQVLVTGSMHLVGVALGLLDVKLW